MRQDETYPHVSGRIPSFPSSGSQKDLAGDLTQEVLILVAYVNLQVAELTGLVPLAFQILRFKMPETRLISVRRGGSNQGFSMTCGRPIPAINRAYTRIRATAHRY